LLPPVVKKHIVSSIRLQQYLLMFFNYVVKSIFLSNKILKIKK